MRAVLDIFLVFLRLGLTSFGGPVAHLGYFRRAFVERLKWLDDRAYADLVALCQFLPGPASSQVGMGVGLMRGGYAGMAAAWFGFSLPSVVLLILAAAGFAAVGQAGETGWLHGLKVAAVGIVALAVTDMARSLAPDRPRATLAVAAAVLALAVPNAFGQIGAILLGGLVGLAVLDGERPGPRPDVPIRGGRIAIAALGLFFVLLAGLPLLAAATDHTAIDLFDTFYRAGALVFGGGHVVLPLLQAELVPTEIGRDAFLAGYGAAQAVPGPLFTFAAYLGATILPEQGGVPGALLCTAAIFLPSALLVIGVLPFWIRLRHVARLRAALDGINAAVVGLLLAAFYDPVWTAGIQTPRDFALLAVTVAALSIWRVPAWAVVAACAAAGAALPR